MDVSNPSNSGSDGQYIPGICNIGEEEVKVRKIWLAVSVLAVILFSYFSIKHESNYWIKTCLFISFSAFVVLFIQVRQKFCVTFGMLGYFNFNNPGKVMKVRDTKDVLQDRKKVMKIILISCSIGVLYTLLISLF